MKKLYLLDNGLVIGEFEMSHLIITPCDEGNLRYGRKCVAVLKMKMKQPFGFPALNRVMDCSIGGSVKYNGVIHFIKNNVVLS